MDIPDIFPSLAGKTSREVNLDDEAGLYLEAHGFRDDIWNWQWENPLIRPAECAKFLSWVHEKYGIDFSYGGYGEDRSTLWHDTYLDQHGAYHHLGIDINTPSWTELLSPVRGKVIVSDHDSDHPDAPQLHGWGNRLIIRPEDSEYALILAHLSDTTRRRVGTLIEKWEPLWTIGTSEENGWWFEHFHIQVILRERLMDLLEKGHLAQLDGYSRIMDAEMRKIYPNPFETL